MWTPRFGRLLERRGPLKFEAQNDRNAMIGRTASNALHSLILTTSKNKMHFPQPCREWMRVRKMMGRSRNLQSESWNERISQLIACSTVQDCAITPIEDGVSDWKSSIIILFGQTNDDMPKPLYIMY